jgi:hypothetical protein
MCSYCNTLNITLTNGLCDLCTTINTDNKNLRYRTIFIKSNLTQKEVIQNTITYYKKYGSIPSPNELDPNAKRINFSSCNLKYLIFTDMKIKNLINKKKIVMFMTIDYTLNNIIPFNVFMKNTKNTSYWKDVEKMPIYNINKYIY